MKVVLVFFISLLSFSVGTFVGKQVSDSEHRKLALEGEFKGEGREIASEKPAVEGGEGGKISEKEVASLTEEFVAKEGEAHEAKPDAEGYKTYARGEGKSREVASEETKGEAPKAEAEAKTEGHHAAVAEKASEAKAEGHHAAAEKVAEAKAAVEGKEKAKVKDVETPSVASAAVGKYTVQVASYAKEDEAKEHAAKLKGKGYQAFYLSAKVNGKDWYRVLVGLFGTVKGADEYKAQLIKDGGVKAAYVQKIVQ